MPLVAPYSSIGQPEAWLLYGVKTAGLVRLDPAAYPSIHRPNVDPVLGRDVPKPEWVCQGPNGGLHVHASTRRIDVHIAEQPIPRVELNQVRGYALDLIRTSWLDPILDLINAEHVFVGDVILKGEILPDWRTIRSHAQPLLRSKKAGVSLACANCGYQSSFPHSKPLYFADPQIVGEPVLATGNGIFVREDLALARNLPRPLGAFKPLRVVLRTGPEAGRT